MTVPLPRWPQEGMIHPVPCHAVPCLAAKDSASGSADRSTGSEEGTLPCCLLAGGNDHPRSPLAAGGESPPRSLRHLQPYVRSQELFGDSFALCGRLLGTHFASPERVLGPLGALGASPGA